MLIESPLASVVGDGQGGKASLSVLYGPTILALKQNMSTYLAARAGATIEAFNGYGKVVYTVAPYIASSKFAYDQTASNFGQAIQRTVEITNINTNNINFPFTDIAQMQEGGALEAQWVSNMTSIIEADFNIGMFNALSAYFLANPGLTVYFPELVTENQLTTDQYRYIQKLLRNIKNSIRKVISPTALFVKGNDIRFLIDCYAEANIEMLYTALSSSDKAFDVMKNGLGGDNGDRVFIGGSELLIDNFLNKNVEANVIHQDYGCDNSNVLGYVMHKEFFAFPQRVLRMRTAVNFNNAVDVLVAVYGYGFGVLRPELGKQLVKTLGVFQSPEDPKQMVCNAQLRGDLGTPVYSITGAGLTIDAKTGLISGTGTGTVTVTIGTLTATKEVTIE